MNSFVIYIDEDAMGRKLVAALRDRDVVVATAYDSNQVKASDERQLEYATTNSFVLYTFNVCDYYQLHTQWLAQQIPWATGTRTASTDRKTSLNDALRDFGLST